MCAPYGVQSMESRSLITSPPHGSSFGRPRPLPSRMPTCRRILIMRIHTYMHATFSFHPFRRAHSDAKEMGKTWSQTPEHEDLQSGWRPFEPLRHFPLIFLAALSWYSPRLFGYRNFHVRTGYSGLRTHTTYT